MKNKKGHKQDQKHSLAGKLNEFKSVTFESENGCRLFRLETHKCEIRFVELSKVLEGLDTEESDFFIPIEFAEQILTSAIKMINDTE